MKYFLLIVFFTVATITPTFSQVDTTSSVDKLKLILGGPRVIYNVLVFNGTYQSHRKFDNITLTLKKDSTYKQTWSSCTYDYKATGKWKTKGDTVMLFLDKMKAKINQYESERVIKETNKLEISFNSDTLSILKDKGTTGVYRTYIPLIKVK